jgi:hypothetical protein
LEFGIAENVWSVAAAAADTLKISGRTADYRDVRRLPLVKRSPLLGLLLTGICLQVFAMGRDNKAQQPDTDSDEVMQVLDSNASAVVHNDVRSVKVTVHAFLTDKNGDDVPLTMVCWAHGVIGFGSCRRLTPGEYHFRRDKGNRISLISYSFDHKEHDLRFTVVEYDNAD